MWSGPRNISTAIMRSFENRPDTFITDEPFYAYYLYKTKEDHPMKEEIINHGEISWDMVVKHITGDIPNNKSIWYQKHMVQHCLPGDDIRWTEKLLNVLLIRNPKEVILSYSKKYVIKNTSQLGYPGQTKLLNTLIENKGSPPIIIDARDILNNPKRILKLLCIKLDISFLDEMLSWKLGKRKTDGIWGKHWYSNVENSTEFMPHTKNNTSIPLKYKKIYEECMEHYQHLYKQRMR